MGIAQLGTRDSYTREICGSVVKKLISKAEKRKKTAKNFHVYALLQATILRLKIDDHKTAKKVKSYCNKRQYSSNYLQKISSNVNVTDTEVSDTDPLQLNTFFEQLRER